MMDDAIIYYVEVKMCRPFYTQNNRRHTMIDRKSVKTDQVNKGGGSTIQVDRVRLLSSEQKQVKWVVRGMTLVLAKNRMKNGMKIKNL